MFYHSRVNAFTGIPCCPFCARDPSASALSLPSTTHADIRRSPTTPSTAAHQREITHTC